MPIESVPVPPAAGDVSADFVRRTVHRDPDGPVVDRSADVQAAAATTTVSERSRVAGKRGKARLMRNLGAYRV
jgi:hypothetical protein